MNYFKQINESFEKMHKKILKESLDNKVYDDEELDKLSAKELLD